MTAGQRSASELAALILALGCLRHYVWPLVPLEAGPSVWKIGSAVCIGGLLLLHWLREPSRLLGWVLVWFAFEEAQIIVGEVWWLLAPWEVPEGMGVMEARTGLSTVTAGLFAVAWFAVRLSPVKSDRSQHAK